MNRRMGCFRARCALAMGLGLALLACGEDEPAPTRDAGTDGGSCEGSACDPDDAGPDAEGGAAALDSYSELLAAVGAPTGQVSAASVPAVVAEYEEVNPATTQVSFSPRLEPAASLHKQSPLGASVCTEGGDLELDASAAESLLDYEQCCLEGCCYDGEMRYYFETQGTTSAGTCLIAALDLACAAEGTQRLDFLACTDESGYFAYLLTTDDGTFTVGGDYVEGDGTLTILGANGEFECVFEAYAGTCTADAESFEVSL